MNIRGALLVCLAFAAIAAPAHANDRWGDDIAVMNDNELDAHRGGFEIDGLSINFGATVTTLVNGVPALVTTLTWTDVGAIVEETVGELGQDLASMTPEQLTALGLDGLETASGVVIEDEAGVTALVHNVADGALQNIIINSATGRDLSQHVDVTLELPGFEAIQRSLLVESLGIRLSDDMTPFLADPGG